MWKVISAVTIRDSLPPPSSCSMDQVNEESYKVYV